MAFLYFLVFFNLSTDDVQVFQLLLIDRRRTFVRPVKARFAQGLDSVVCRRFAEAYRLTSIGSAAMSPPIPSPCT